MHFKASAKAANRSPMPWLQLSEILGLAKGGAVRQAVDDLWDALAGPRKGTSAAAFTVAVISLCAKMAKADGVVVQVEADAFERHLEANYGSIEVQRTGRVALPRLNPPA